MPEILIRNMEQNDKYLVIEIMNHGIDEEVNAYETPFNEIEGQTWIEHLWSSARVFLVAEMDQMVVGWGTLTPYRSGRGRLDKVLEISFYVHKEFRNQSVATHLMIELEAAAKAFECTHLIGILIDQNLKSSALLEKRGYDRCAYMRNIVRFENGFKGHCYYIKAL